MRSQTLFGAATALALALALGSPASALTMKECSTKYQAAKQTGSTAKWNDFRKAECGTETSTTSPTAASPAIAAASRSAPPSAPVAPKPVSAPATSATVAYPSAVDPKYAKESAGKARMHTCLDSYNAAKASGSLGDTKWIVKGGGYYSACNARLKG